MRFKKISIKNFRNFENVSIKLDNKNIFFGMNDVGKTNFLYALRYIFDRDIRKNDLIDTDYFQKKTELPIEIIVSIDISDVNDSDSEKLRAKVKGALLSHQDIVYIKLKAEYDKTMLRGNPVMYWGGDYDDLQEIRTRGYYYDIDSVFDVVYIDAYVDLYNLFKKNTPVLLKNDDELDKEKLEHIDETIKSLNNDIASLSGIVNFEERVTPEYNSFRQEQIEIAVKSEMGVKGLYSNVVPYIKKEGTEELYPTAGEGRKKLLVYSIYDLLAEENSEKKIVIYLIEEPENHLHRAMQMALSKRVFLDEKYKYSFLTTHSSHVLAEMDHVNLVRIYNENKINTKSSFYSVPEKYAKQKQQLNKGLAEAIFSDSVLLVEGPSEESLFSKVLSVLDPYYNIHGIYILDVGGFGFKPYLSIMNELGIFCVVKTDNDLRKASGNTDYSVIGFSRLNSIIGRSLLPTSHVTGNSIDDKRKLYDSNKETLDEIGKKYHIYLSRVSLEEDLDEVIHDEMNNYLPEAGGDPVSYLKESKKYHMVELVEKLTDNDCQRIVSHYNFRCLGEFLK